MERVAQTTTCQHGLDASSCLICATLSPVQTSAGRTPRAERVSAGKAEVLLGGPRRGHRVGLLGAAVVVFAALFVVWLLIHLFWSLLHLVELGLVGVVCGVVGYRIGELVGRHRRP